MYSLSSYVVGGVVTALALTPFVAGPNSSFVGTLLATPAHTSSTGTAISASVNRALKGDRQAPASVAAEQATTAQTVMPKTTSKTTQNDRKTTPASLTAPEPTPSAPQRLLDGCESSFSEISAQASAIPGRCVAALPDGAPVRVAALN